MNKWFEVKVKYEKIDERGAVKKVTEPYLLDSLTHTEAEARAILELEPYLSGEFIVSRIAPANYTDVFPFDDGDRWFKCKLNYISIDEEKGTEKRKTSYVLVQANDVKHAWNNLSDAMSDSVVDYEVKGINETAIMDVFPYSADSVASAVPEHLTEYPATEEECFKIKEDQEVQRPDCTRCKNELPCTSKHKHSKSLINCGDFVFFDRSKISEKD